MEEAKRRGQRGKRKAGRKAAFFEKLRLAEKLVEIVMGSNPNPRDSIAATLSDCAVLRGHANGPNVIRTA
jgi:hypothetical protein